jgi:hypothetical protein
MDRIYKILNSLVEAAKSVSVNTPMAVKPGDKVKNINSLCKHYGSEGIVNSVDSLPDDMGSIVSYVATNSGQFWNKDDILKKTMDQLQPMSTDTRIETNDLIAEENESPETELMEYKEDFYEMNIGSLRAIANHSQAILDAIDNPSVKENLTESWLQGKIAITEDYMRTIHDFIMYVSEDDDTSTSKDKQGLWDNIRQKKQREGKKYRPAKPGDDDRPDPKMWKKLTK